MNTTADVASPCRSDVFPIVMLNNQSQHPRFTEAWHNWGRRNIIARSRSVGAGKRLLYGPTLPALCLLSSVGDGGGGGGWIKRRLARRLTPSPEITARSATYRQESKARQTKRRQPQKEKRAKRVEMSSAGHVTGLHARLSAPPTVSG